MIMKWIIVAEQPTEVADLRESSENASHSADTLALRFRD
jgi:hypothetical protein